MRPPAGPNREIYAVYSKQSARRNAKLWAGYTVYSKQYSWRYEPAYLYSLHHSPYSKLEYAGSNCYIHCRWRFERLLETVAAVRCQRHC
jgi:hypothetical protein